MRKLLKFSATICALIMALSVGVTSAFAAGRTTTILEDSFGNKNYEGETDPAKWAKIVAEGNDDAIRQKDMVTNQSLEFIKGLSGGDQIQFGTKNKLENIKSVQFSFMIPVQETPEAWVGISFVGQIDPTKPGSNIYDTKLMFGSSIGKLGDVVGKWVSVKIVPTSNTTADVWYVLRNEDGTADFSGARDIAVNGFKFSSIDKDESLSEIEKAQQKSEKIEKEGWSYKHAHILWGVSGFGNGTCIDDIKIEYQYKQLQTEADGSPKVDGNGDYIYSYVDDVITNNFDSLDIESNESHFRAYEGVRKADEAFAISEDGKLLFDKTKKGDRLISYERVKKDDSVANFIKCLDVSFSVQMTHKSSDEIAFVFGLENEEADPTENGIVYLIKSDSVSGVVTGRFIEYKDGEVLSEQATGHVLEKVAMKNGATLTIEIYKDGESVVKHNGHVVSNDFKASKYDGCIGFYSPKDNDGIVQLDNIFVSNSTYVVPKTKSVTHNFENDFFGNEDYKDFYMTATGGEIKVDDGKLVFDYCSDFSYFGSAHEYDGFVLDYQIHSIFVSDKVPGQAGWNNGTYPGTWIGLDIGRERVSQNEYGSFINILFPIHPGDAEMISPSVYIKETVSPLRYRDLKFTKYAEIPASLVTDLHYDNVSKSESQIKLEDALCVRFVSDPETGSVKLYLKKYGEAEFKLYYEVFVQATGYVAIATTGYTTLKIDNFSMSNNSAIYEIADSEAPQTIYPEPEIEHIYTKPDVDVNLDEEIKLNLGGKLSWLWMLGGLIVGLGGFGAGFYMYLKAKKLAGQTVTKTEETDEGKGV